MIKNIIELNTNIILINEKHKNAINEEKHKNAINIEKHKNEINIEKHKNEIKDKDIEILQYKIKFLELHNKL